MKEEKHRVGVYVCHCGHNIAGVINCERLAEEASKRSEVVIGKDNMYMCADQGQELVKNDIKEHKLDRVIVAACSPRMHEHTFRKCVSEAGLNPYLFEMANIREFCTWCHSNQKEEAYDKAVDLIDMALEKAKRLKPLDVIKVPVTKSALIIGGGVAGIHAALDLADMGFKVYLVERNPSIGGRMAMLDKTFPTLDCSICILGPKMVDVSHHPNIELLTWSEVKSIDGFVGNFKVKIEKKPRYVIGEKCNGCGDCVVVCPIDIPNEFDQGLGPRKAIYVPFPQSVPLIYTIDLDSCIYCMNCVEACGDKEAIDFDMTAEEVEIDVGAIILATGYDLMDVSGLEEYGYGKYDNVFTALELERMINASGPTEGNVIRFNDREVPKTIAFIQCVGSRNVEKLQYCSGFCCMYALKNSMLLKEHHPDAEIFVFFMDIRANFRGYEEFYRRTRGLGITFIRGRTAKITEMENGNLLVNATDMDLGEQISVEVEMVVLSPAAVPSSGTDDLSQILHLTRGSDGFFLEAHPKLKPIDTASDGIFLCGSAQGPKDIPYSVSQGLAAASRAARILSQEYLEIEPMVAVVDPDKCLKCGQCVEKCPFEAIEFKPGKPARVIAAKCHGCGTCVAECPGNAITQKHFTDDQILSQIRAALKVSPEHKILAFLCNWCSYAGADLAGTSRYQYPPNVRPIRVMCSGRVDRDFVLEAFRLGAGMVLVSGCRLSLEDEEITGSDCHYIKGNYHAKNRIEALYPLLKRAGIDPKRLRLEWVSAAEGERYAKIMKEMTTYLNSIGQSKVKKETEEALPTLNRFLRRMDENSA